MEPVDSTAFAVIETRTLAAETIRIRGDLTVDALSPNGRWLYLVEHMGSSDDTPSRYRVRAYDLRTHRLLSRVIADKRQRGWLMQGFPLHRTETADGGRVYTLYQAGGNYPFVHALDTVNRTAFCIGLPIPWRDPAVMEGTTLRLDPANGDLVVRGPNLEREYRIDTINLQLR